MEMTIFLVEMTTKYLFILLNFSVTQFAPLGGIQLNEPGVGGSRTLVLLN
jgi:hypothetical protein